MSKCYEFLKDCGVFYLFTVNGDSPAGRSFAAVMESGNALYIAAADTKAVYRQMREKKYWFRLKHRRSLWSI